MPDHYDTAMAQLCAEHYGRTPGWLRLLLERDERRVADLRSHEPPRNSGEGTAVNGPMPLAGGDDANESP
jgi:hypothetical protein